MSEDMIECVAAAIAMKSEGWTKNAKDYIPHARAAIEAMRNGSIDVSGLVERLQKIAGPVRMENGSFSDDADEAATSLTALAAKVAEMEAENEWLWGRVDELEVSRAFWKRVSNGWSQRTKAYKARLAEALKALDELADDDEPADVEGLQENAREAARRIREGGE